MDLYQQIDSGNYFDENYYIGNKKSNYGSYENYPFFGDFAECIAKKFHPKKILEVGCAKGFMVLRWRQLGIEAYGVDISKWAVANAPQEIKSYVFVGDMRNLKWADNSFDVVCAFETLEHILPKDIDKAVNELHRVTNSFVLLSMPTSKGKEDNDASHVSIHSKNYWIAKFERAGFAIDYFDDWSFGKWTVKNFIILRKL